MKILIAIALTALILAPTAAFGLTDGQRYRSGYQHGCSDSKNGLNYLAGSGGSSAHTSSFMTGYDDGYKHCNTRVADGTSARASATASASATGNSVTIINNR